MYDSNHIIKLGVAEIDVDWDSSRARLVRRRVL